MYKPFKSIEQQVRLLQGRRVITDDQTARILLREGYYAVVNGYGKPFLDEKATAAAGDDRYRRGTTFKAIYQLFLFDRELRSLTFRAIMCVEGTLRAILSHTFCEHHRKLDAYLDRSCYTTERHYLRGTDSFAGDLAWMINTLEHHARGHLGDERDDDPGSTERVAWYRTHYDEVPLWVLFADLTFGNLRYFYALMQPREQSLVCRRMREACGATADGDDLSPKEMLHDLEVLSKLRNDCAHEERIYNTTYGEDELGYQRMLKILVAYLTDEDERQLADGIDELVERHVRESPALAPILKDAGFRV